METVIATPPLRLSELAAAVSAAVNKAFALQQFWVVADVMSHTFKADSKYHYFDLVEKDPGGHALVAKVSAKSWGAGSLSIERFQVVTGQQFTNNIHVLVNVSVQFHPVFGLQLNLNEIDPTFTLGMLELQRRETLERLVLENPEFIQRVGDGYRTRNKQLPLPQVIQRLAVISSKTSAGWQDFRHTLENNPLGYRFFVDDYFTVVQGEANAGQLVERLVDVFRSSISYDAVVLIRGGGAQTDFLLFDHYMIGKAVAKFPIPIITGIGHQKNETIADVMAHLATKTPTKAAEFIINHNRAFEDAVITFQRTIVIKSQQRFSHGFQSLSKMNSLIVNKARDLLGDRDRELLTMASLVSTRPRVMVYNKLNDLQQIVSNIRTFQAMYVKNQLSYLGHLVTVIRLLSPENTLKRGFALIKSGGRVTGDPNDLVVGKDIDILFRDKTITTTVKTIKDSHGNDFNV